MDLRVAERRVEVTRSRSLSELENGTFPELLPICTMYLRIIQERLVILSLARKKLWSVDGLLMVCGWSVDGLWMDCE